MKIEHRASVGVDYLGTHSGVRTLSQNSIVTAGAGRGVGGTKVEGSSREASFSAAGAGQTGAAEVMVVD